MSVTSPAGFRASGVAAGLKQSGAPDVALVVNDGPAQTASVVLTRNRVQAAPVQWTRQACSDNRLAAVVLNSGGANACTGPQGFQASHATAEAVATALGLSAADVAVCSTGLIGTQLRMEQLLPGVRQACAEASRAGGAAAAMAICTTDTVPKTANLLAHGVTVGGMAKGAGVLAPSLATMLVVLTTDADADPGDLDAALRSAVATTFERLDSDGCTSTNDTVLVMCSGASDIRLGEPELTQVLTAICADLARQLVADAEGASKEVEVCVRGAVSVDDAIEVGRAVARNNLLKCALGGEDPNWGRVLAAVGTTEAVFDPAALDVAINGVWVCRSCAPGDERELVDLSGRSVVITVDLHAGPFEASVWTNDLTAAYVHENSAYAT